MVCTDINLSVIESCMRTTHRTAMLSKHNICFVKFLVVVLMLHSTDVMVTSVFGAKILFVPANMNSHVLFFSRLAADLTQLGHVTEVLAPANARVPYLVAEFERGGNFTYRKYHVDGDEPFLNSRYVSEFVTRLVLTQSTWRKFSDGTDFQKEVLSHFLSDCVRLLDNLPLMKQIRSAGFQFAVMDPKVPYCYYAIPYSTRMRYATLSRPSFTWTYRVPRFPSFSSTIGLDYTDEMTLLQRVTAFVFESLLLIQLQNETTAYVARLAPDLPAINSFQLL